MSTLFARHPVSESHAVNALVHDLADTCDVNTEDGTLRTPKPSAAWPGVGIFPDMPFADYVAIEAVNASLLKYVYRQSCKHAKDYLDRGMPETRSTDFGNIMHYAILEPDRALEMVIVGKKNYTKDQEHLADLLLCGAMGPAIAQFLYDMGVKTLEEVEEMGAHALSELKPSGKARYGMSRAEKVIEGIPEAIASRGKEVFEQSTVDKALTAASSLGKLDLLRGLLKNAKKEVTITWEETRWKIGGQPLRCKARIDALAIRDKELDLIDLKSSKNIASPSWWKDFFSFGYDLQQGWYRRGLRNHFDCTNEQIDCYIPAVENKPPYDCVVYPISISHIDYGERKAVQAARDWFHAVKTGNFPGQFGDLDIPAPGEDEPPAYLLPGDAEIERLDAVEL